MFAANWDWDEEQAGPIDGKTGFVLASLVVNGNFREADYPESGSPVAVAACIWKHLMHVWKAQPVHTPDVDGPWIGHKRFK